MGYIDKIFISIIVVIVLIFGITLYITEVGTSTRLSDKEIAEACNAAGGHQLWNRAGPTVCIKKEIVIEIDRQRK